MDWQRYLEDEFEELENSLKKSSLLVKDDFKVYLLLLESGQEMIGSQLLEKLPDLKRTHVYSILTRLQNQGWIEITNPRKRPAKYRALDPLRSVEQIIGEQEDRLEKLKKLRDYIKDTVLPAIKETPLFGGRISSTYLISNPEDLYQQLYEMLSVAQDRIMAHCPISTIIKLKNPLIEAIDRILKNYTSEKEITTLWDIQVDHLAITAVTDQKELDLDLPIRIALDPNALHSEMFVIDNTVIIYLIDAPKLPSGIRIGLGLRIEDISVANGYAHLLSHIFEETWIFGLPQPDIDSIITPIMDDPDIKAAMEKLFHEGWKFLSEHSDPSYPHIGLVSPEEVFGPFRECGIVYDPFQDDEDISKRIQRHFDITARIFKEEAEREGNLKATFFDGKNDVLGIECLTRHLTIDFPEKWQREGILQGIPESVYGPKTTTDPPSIVAFNYKDRAAVVVWAVNPLNVLTIMKTILNIT